jgi:hypothetical protein
LNILRQLLPVLRLVEVDFREQAVRSIFELLPQCHFGRTFCRRTVGRIKEEEKWLPIGGFKELEKVLF